MSRIPTPIPKSLVAATERAFSGSNVDLVWKSLIVLVLLALGVALASAGPVGIVVSGLLLGSLLNGTVRDIIVDVWNREFYAAEV